MRHTSLVLVALLVLGGVPARAAHHESESGGGVAQSGMGSEAAPLAGSLEPTPDSYTTDYYFPMTRSLADSTLHPAWQAPLFLIAIPVDIVLLPGAAVAGFF